MNWGLIVIRQVELFLNATGNAPVIGNKEDLINQVAKIRTHMISEVYELNDAIHSYDVVEVLDAYADIKAYLTQLKLLFEAYGIDVVEAENCVCINNSLKYTSSAELAFNWLEEYTQQGMGNDFYVEATLHEGVTFYCLRRKSDDKVYKYLDFPKVDLKPHIPDDLLED